MRNARKKLTLGITLTVVITLAAVAAIYMKRPFPTGDTPTEPPQMAEQSVMYLSGVRQTATKDGAVQWEMEAESAELEAASGRMTLRAPRVAFYLEDGERVYLTADEGVLYTKNNDIEARGNVHIRESRYTFTTETLTYQHDTRVLHSESGVRIESARMTLNAQTLWYNLNSRQALFSGDVQGKIYEAFPL